MVKVCGTAVPKLDILLMQTVHLTAAANAKQKDLILRFVKKKKTLISFNILSTWKSSNCNGHKADHTA